MQRQRNGFITVNRMKHEQYCDAAFFVIAPLADARIALHDEVIIGEGAQIVETIQIGQNLTAQSISQA